MFVTVNRIQTMSTKAHSNTPPNQAVILLAEKLYSFSQLCELLQISRQTVYNWIEQKILTPRKIRGRVYFLGSDLIKILHQDDKQIKS